eukprot:TRINITY_DN25795_c0_g1_i2.p1 TRINITY_DN25795_c0_g1~~TRINITY_DN25795_c0_g1_i2.p1  ORF type:complete len:105 (-),score=21.17 TRINITY_DN25795_c0_g1_i2:225-539(-)
MIRRPPRSTLSSSSAASDVYKRQPLYLHACPTPRSFSNTNIENTMTSIPAALIRIGAQRVEDNVSPSLLPLSIGSGHNPISGSDVSRSSSFELARFDGRLVGLQ